MVTYLIKAEKMRLYLNRMLLCAGFSVLAVLTACQWAMPSQINTNKIRVMEDKNSLLFDTAAFGEDQAAYVSNHYRRYGDGAASVTVTYEPRSNHNTASHAGRELGRILTALKRSGLKDVRGDILPVNTKGEPSKVLIGYTMYTAHAPEDCEVMQGVESDAAKVDWDYKLGCTIDIMTARQVARPKDLLGNAELGSGDAMREGARAGIVRTGEDLGALTGESLE